MTIEVFLDKYKVMIYGNRIIINDKVGKITEEELKELVGYTINWKDNYTNNKIFESEEYMVKVDDNEYIFKGSYPENFSSFINFLGGLYDRK